MSTRFVLSYSGGKESILSLYHAQKAGLTPVALLTTFRTDHDASHFHGISEAVLQRASAALETPLCLVKTSGADYEANFTKALVDAKAEGASACVFGDIDIEGHRLWCTALCEKIGLEPLFPLWGRARHEVVSELIDLGFRANIATIDRNFLTTDFLGKVLTHALCDEIAASGADVCGENGEYHTFVSDGPIFRHPVAFTFGEIRETDHYSTLSLF